MFSNRLKRSLFVHTMDTTSSSFALSNILTSDSILRLEDYPITCRASDGYVNLSEECEAGGKLLGHWKSNRKTGAFLQALSASIGIPINELVVYEPGSNDERATWGHPQVAIHIAQWISPEFDVKVSKWIWELAATGKVSLADERSIKELDKAWKEQIELLEGKLQEKDAILEKASKDLEKTEAKLAKTSHDLAHTKQLHDRLLRKKTRHQFKKGHCVYIISHSKDPGIKCGYTEDFTHRLTGYHSSVSTPHDVHGIFYCSESDAKFLEKSIHTMFRDQLVSGKKEWFKPDLTLKEFEAGIRAILKLLRLDFTEEDLTEYNKPAVHFFDIPLHEPEKEPEEEYVKMKAYVRVPADKKETHKKCSKCLYLKPKAHFDADSTRPDKLSTYCKPCLAEKRKKTKENAPVLDPESSRQCKDCGETKMVKDFNKSTSYKDGYFPQCKECLEQSQVEREVLGQVVEPGEFKTCTACKENKTIENFTKDLRKKDGLAQYCKPCLADRRKNSSNIEHTSPGTTKECRVCKKSLPIDSFWAKKASKDGKNNKCKECHKK